MQAAFWERASGYEVKVSKGFTQLKDCAFTGLAADGIRDFRKSPADKSNMAKYVFGGFERCLYPALKFQSNTERKMAIILDRESMKWFKPANGQFQIYYLDNGEQREYQPDFVAETESIIYMVEAKQADRINDIDVLAKRDAAVRWCRRATDHALEYGGGGTDCSLRLVAANQKHAKRKFAGVVLVSDNESWVGTGQHGSTGVMTA